MLTTHRSRISRSIGHIWYGEIDAVDECYYYRPDIVVFTSFADHMYTAFPFIFFFLMREFCHRV
jgi:hypothetical protein